MCSFKNYCSLKNLDNIFSLRYVPKAQVIKDTNIPNTDYRKYVYIYMIHHSSDIVKSTDRKSNDSTISSDIASGFEIAIIYQYVRRKRQVKCFENYCPISQVSNTAKSFEKIIKSELVEINSNPINYFLTHYLALDSIRAQYRLYFNRFSI